MLKSLAISLFFSTSTMASPPLDSQSVIDPLRCQNQLVGDVPVSDEIRRLSVEDFLSRSYDEQKQLVGNSPHRALMLTRQASSGILIFDLQSALAQSLPIFFGQSMGIDADQVWLDRVLETFNIFYGTEWDQKIAAAITPSDLEFVGDVLPVRIVNGMALLSLKTNFFIDKKLADFSVVNRSLNVPSFEFKGPLSRPRDFPSNIYFQYRNQSGHYIMFTLDNPKLLDVFSGSSEMAKYFRTIGFNKWLKERIAELSTSDLNDTFYYSYRAQTIRENFLIQIVRASLSRDAFVYQIKAISQLSVNEVLALISNRVRAQTRGQMFSNLYHDSNNVTIHRLSKSLETGDFGVKDVRVPDLLLSYAYHEPPAVKERLLRLLLQAGTSEKLTELKPDEMIRLHLSDKKDVGKFSLEHDFIFLRDTDGVITLIGYY